MKISTSQRVRVWGFTTLFFMLLAIAAAPRAAAQSDGSISGTILDVVAKPWVGIEVQITSDQGAKQSTKTDKDGNYIFRNLRVGVYTVAIQLPAPNKPYEVKAQVQGGSEAKASINFKDVVASHPEAAEQQKKQAEDKQKFEGMKQHFTAGTTILEQERQAKTELTKAAADQRDAAKQKVTELSDQAATEFKAAQQAAGEKDSNQHIIWAKLGEAYDIAGRNDEAASAYRQAVAAKPDIPGYYNNLGNVLARSGKIDEAREAYTKSAELDPPNAAGAWRNFGISLYNANQLKDAVEPLKKATTLDPKNAQAWYLLGAALVGTMETKKNGDKLEFVIQPGTVEAYKQAEELDPNGPYGQQAKQGLEALAAIAPGIDTKVNAKKKKGS